MYKVESVELPQAKGRQTKYPFKTLEVGESFLIIASPAEMTKTQRKMSALSVVSGKRYGKKFITRRMEDGVRIFRIEEVKS
jgi:hypothetical protein